MSIRATPTAPMLALAPLLLAAAHGDPSPQFHLHLASTACEQDPHEVGDAMEMDMAEMRGASDEAFSLWWEAQLARISSQHC